jgi:ketosteroid isomerase-like protein
MTNNQALETVEQYFKLWSQKDYQGSRAYLADDLYFKGPFDTFQRADDLIQAVSRLGPMVKEIRTRRILADGQSVCIVYDMVTSTPIGTAPIAEVFEVRSGKITSILAFFDPRPFVPLFG